MMATVFMPSWPRHLVRRFGVRPKAGHAEQQRPKFAALAVYFIDVAGTLLKNRGASLSKEPDLCNDGRGGELSLTHTSPTNDIQISVLSDPKSSWTPRLSVAPAVADRSATILVACRDPNARLHLRELLHAE